ncbi:sodium-dependent transporter [uncultured Marinobacter sp.]|uniref:sodium-dependent transporter n=1 Tax=uncultured Marinobacter sp. TaxID=187379 RepID=UPI0030D8098E
MPSVPHTSLGLWTGRSTFFWAATAATVGLGNLWQFLLVITLPLMLAETALGRYSRHSMVLAVAGEVRSHYLSPRWVWIGRASVLSGFLVLSMTLVVGAICLAYVFYGALGRFVDADAVTLAAMLRDLVESPHDYRYFMAWHGLMIVLVGVVAMRRGAAGLERAVRLVIPLFILILLGLLWWLWGRETVAVSTGMLLSFDRESLTWEGSLQALSHAFYTLGLGLGVWAVMGAMMAPGTPFKRSVLAVALVDTLVGVLAGILIYSLVLGATGDAEANGFGLVFVALPLGLSAEPYGPILATVMFTAITLVAWTSALVLVEAVTGWLREWTGAQRQGAVMLVLVAAWLVGLISLFSFNIWSDRTLAGLTAFRWIELLTSGVLIPLASACLALFLGWLMPRHHLTRLLGNSPQWLSSLWLWALRLVLPVVVLAIGSNYTVTSFRVLCDSGNLTWCAPTTTAPVHESPSTPGAAIEIPAPADNGEEGAGERSGEANAEDSAGEDEQNSPDPSGDAAI